MLTNNLIGDITSRTWWSLPWIKWSVYLHVVSFYRRRANFIISFMCMHFLRIENKLCCKYLRCIDCKQSVTRVLTSPSFQHLSINHIHTNLAFGSEKLSEFVLLHVIWGEVGQYLPEVVSGSGAQVQVMSAQVVSRTGLGQSGGCRDVCAQHNGNQTCTCTTMHINCSNETFESGRHQLGLNSFDAWCKSYVHRGTCWDIYFEPVAMIEVLIGMIQLIIFNVFFSIIINCSSHPTFQITHSPHSLIDSHFSCDILPEYKLV